MTVKFMHHKFPKMLKECINTTHRTIKLKNFDGKLDIYMYILYMYMYIIYTYIHTYIYTYIYIYKFW